MNPHAASRSLIATALGAALLVDAQPVTNTVGGWNPVAITDHETALLQKALASEANYNADVTARVCVSEVKSLAQQVVAGTNYRFVVKGCAVDSAQNAGFCADKKRQLWASPGYQQQQPGQGQYPSPGQQQQHYPGQGQWTWPGQQQQYPGQGQGQWTWPGWQQWSWLWPWQQQQQPPSTPCPSKTPPPTTKTPTPPPSQVQTPPPSQVQTPPPTKPQQQQQQQQWQQQWQQQQQQQKPMLRTNTDKCGDYVITIFEQTWTDTLAVLSIETA